MPITWVYHMGGNLWLSIKDIAGTRADVSTCTAILIGGGPLSSLITLPYIAGNFRGVKYSLFS